jgi:CheY-like chemotaxis protein
VKILSKLIKAISPQIVLIDVMMPGEGAKAFQIIRQTPEISDIPVILFSALSNIKEIFDSRSYRNIRKAI